MKDWRYSKNIEKGMRQIKVTRLKGSGEYSSSNFKLPPIKDAINENDADSFTREEQRVLPHHNRSPYLSKDKRKNVSEVYF